MYDILIDKLKKNKLIIENDKISPWLKRKIPQELEKEVVETTSFLNEKEDLSVRISAILLQYDDTPSCIVCNSPTKYHKSLKNFANTCSKKCGNQIAQKNREVYYEKNYGIKTNLQLIPQEKRILNSKKGNEISKKAIYEKYEIDNVSKLDWVKKKISSSQKGIKREIFPLGDHYAQRNFDEKQIELLSDMDNIYNLHVSKQIPITILSEKLGFSKSYLSSLLNKEGYDIANFNGSFLQKEFCKDIENNLNNKIQIKENCRSIISPKEIDIYFPDYNLGIEVNGIYWHSVKNTFIDKRHREKWNLCQQKNIKLLQFTSEEIENKYNIVLSMVKNNLKQNIKKIYARKCDIKEVNSKDYKDFCEKNHIQGYSYAEHIMGLYHENVLVCIMSFSKSRYNKNYQYELIRLCSSLNINVVGGASKLLSHFKKIYNPYSIITYADIRYSEGKIYEKLGFEFSHVSPINYRYVRKDGKTESRLKYQKHKLPNLLENFDSSMTEKQNMINNDFRILYDCGNLVYVWSNS